jgi:predicted transcriptional regulator
LSRKQPPGAEENIGARDDRFEMREAHRASMLEGLAQAERGEFASDEVMTALWKKCGL